MANRIVNGERVDYTPTAEEQAAADAADAADAVRIAALENLGAMRAALTDSLYADYPADVLAVEKALVEGNYARARLVIEASAAPQAVKDQFLALLPS